MLLRTANLTTFTCTPLQPRKTLHEQKHKIQLSCTVLREEVTETYFYNPVAFITIKNMQPVQQVKKHRVLEQGLDPGTMFLKVLVSIIYIHF